MYEIEFKVEVTAEERDAFITQLNNNGFIETGVVTQHDHYIEAKKSPHGGTDVKRCRDENGTYIYTEKVWELIDNEPVRKEDEHVMSQEEFDTAVQEADNKISIKKDRLSFEGIYDDKKINVDMDSIKFDHSSSIRYFVEAEIITANKEDVKTIKELLEKFLRQMLEKAELVEAPGMFTMAFEKL